MTKNHKTIREVLKSNKIIWYAYQSLKLLRRFLLSLIKKLRLRLFCQREIRLLKELRVKILGLYPSRLVIRNIGGFSYYYGTNFLGYGGMSHMEKNGINVGMSEGQINSGQCALPIIQLKTDMEINFRNLFAKFKPSFVVDFGTSSGGSAVFFYELMKQYSQPRVLTIDIHEADFIQHLDFHEDYRTKEKILTILNKSSLDCVQDAKEFLSKRKSGEKVLLSFDYEHTYEHTYQELLLYAPLLSGGDVILMQDTWNQGLMGHETSPMLAVHRFLTEHPDFALDEDFCRQMVLPCNFIYGVIVKK